MIPLTVTPYKHQIEAAEFAKKHLTANSAAAYFMEVGTGKTLPAAAIACELGGEAIYGGAVRFNILVVCPIAVFSAWQDAFGMVKVPKRVSTLSGTCVSKAKQLKQGLGINVSVVNYESAWRIMDALIKWRPDMIICDESQKIKSPTSRQSRALHRLGDMTRYRMILTGTPVANNPLDFWSQYRFLHPRIFGTSYYGFRATYAIIEQKKVYSTGQKYWAVIGYRNQDDLIKRAHSIAMRVRKEDCLDLPDQVDETRYVELEPAATKIYKEIKKDAVSELSKGVVSAANIMVRLTRLSQVCGGYVGLDFEDNEKREVECVSKAKLQALTDIAEEVLAQGRKLVIFARFTAEINAIVEEMGKVEVSDHAIGDAAVVCMNGATPPKDRAEIINRFQTNINCRVFVGNPQCAGAGITLTAADTMVFYSLSYSYLDYEQARARIHRIGQKNNCTYIHLLIKDSVDCLVLDKVQKKQNIADIFVDKKQARLLIEQI